MKHIGIVIADRGGAIVTVERDDDALLVTGIERLPFDLAAVTDRVRALADPEARYIIDAEGLGNALWAVLGRSEDAERSVAPALCAWAAHGSGVAPAQDRLLRADQ